MSIRVSQPAINLREKLTETGTPPIGAHGSELMNSSSAGESFDLVKAGRRNMIINGDMQIAQRGTSKASLSNGWTMDTVDRWNWARNNAGTWEVSQDSDVPIGQGFTKSFKADCTTADAAVDAGDYLLLEQTIEANRMAHLCWGTTRAKPVTLSFWVKSSVVGDCSSTLYCNGFNTTRIINQVFTIHNANEWEFKTMSFPAHGPENSFTIDNTIGARLWLWFKGGSSYTAGAGTRNYWRNNTANQQAPGHTINLASSTSNNVWITGVQLEAGYNATPFDYKSYADQLHDCKRYYYKLHNADGDQIRLVGYGGGGTTAGFTVMHQPPMRDTPTGALTANTLSYNDGLAAYSGTGGWSFNGNRFSTDVNTATGAGSGVLTGHALSIYSGGSGTSIEFKAEM